MSTSALRSVSDHQRRVADLIGMLEPAAVPLAEARGLVLADDVVAGEALPSFDNSAMDGYAVRAEDIASAAADAPVRLPVAADIPAGAPVGDLEPGTAHRIMTGAPLPRGADAVVEVEATDGGTDVVAVTAARDAGSFVRTAGGDVMSGTTVLEAGTVIGPAQVGLLAALGVRDVVVRPRPRVLVCSTGSELTDDPTPGAGQIRDSNSHMLAAAVDDAGAVAIRRLWVADDVPTFLRTLDAELGTGVDLLLTSGGVSAGAYEVVKDALGPRGVEFTKVAMQPGMPQGSGTYGGAAVVCLPGNPVSALVSFEVFVRPALRASYGHPRPHRPVVRASLTEAITSTPGKRQLRRGRLDPAAGTVEPWGPPGSGFLGWFAGADCLIDIPADVTDLATGEIVDVWDLTR
ncbi:molybdopterin molybdotransferase MoeA [Nocardioides bizhenqiangii]|uniref:Molybdopterin molybdenumtransferase n=1 Tax=Nocardioides bizhenqiangii TaxID=3095076 RepID=A0ABZ0ZUZ7_9ACTN|nr:MULTISPECIES: gephyrin-like molybdotransferase Glp [unclassified Nocardioides]MDZ5623178.1 gephyrin-like molybdotransferase Glp [Nocardioides sp. HM23]WQQ28151.1 gephyrin-like molybdotransferase Glp [Nocardioides sp. HM61]